MRWDPNGHFLAVGETDGATYLSLPELEPLWVSGARNSGTLNMSMSHDGAWQLVAESYPVLLPLAASLERRPPAEDYFFTQPDFIAISRVADRVRVAGMAFHPAEPVIAIVNRERDSHSIYFQTTEGLVSGDATSLSGDPWAPGSRHLFLVEYAGMGGQEGIDNVILLGELDGFESAEKLDAFPRGDEKLPAGPSHLMEG